MRPGGRARARGPISVGGLRSGIFRATQDSPSPANPVAHGAVDVEPALSAREQVARQGERDLIHIYLADHAGADRGVERASVARYRVLRRRPHHLAVREELAWVVRLIAILVDHPLEIRREALLVGAGFEREQPERAEQRALRALRASMHAPHRALGRAKATRRAPRFMSARSSAPGSKAGSRSSTPTQKRSIIARSKPGTSNTGL